MHRREFIGAAGATASTALAGCLGDADGTGGSTPAAGSPTIGDLPCPPFEPRHDRVVCSHTVDRDGATVYLDAKPKPARLGDLTPGSKIDLRLHNRADARITFNPHSWEIRRRTDEGWTVLDQERVGDGTQTLDPGETYVVTFSQAVAAIGQDPDLAPGLYAAAIGVPDPSDSGWISCIAPVEL